MKFLKKARNLLSLKKKDENQHFSDLTVEPQSPKFPTCRHKSDSRCIKNSTQLCCSCYGDMIPGGATDYCMQCRNYWQIISTAQSILQHTLSQNRQSVLGQRLPSGRPTEEQSPLQQRFSAYRLGSQPVVSTPPGNGFYSPSPARYSTLGVNTAPSPQIQPVPSIPIAMRRISTVEAYAAPFPQSPPIPPKLPWNPISTPPLKAAPQSSHMVGGPIPHNIPLRAAPQSSHMVGGPIPHNIPLRAAPQSSHMASHPMTRKIIPLKARCDHLCLSIRSSLFLPCCGCGDQRTQNMTLKDRVSTYCSLCRQKSFQSPLSSWSTAHLDKKTQVITPYICDIKVVFQGHRDTLKTTHREMRDNGPKYGKPYLRRISAFEEPAVQLSSWFADYVPVLMEGDLRDCLNKNLSLTCVVHFYTSLGVNKDWKPVDYSKTYDHGPSYIGGKWGELWAPIRERYSDNRNLKESQFNLEFRQRTGSQMVVKSVRDTKHGEHASTNVSFTVRYPSESREQVSHDEGPRYGKPRFSAVVQEPKTEPVRPTEDFNDGEFFQSKKQKTKTRKTQPPPQPQRGFSGLQYGKPKLASLDLFNTSSES